MKLEVSMQRGAERRCPFAHDSGCVLRPRTLLYMSTSPPSDSPYHWTVDIATEWLYNVLFTQDFGPAASVPLSEGRALYSANPNVVYCAARSAALYLHPFPEHRRTRGQASRFASQVDDDSRPHSFTSGVFWIASSDLYVEAAVPDRSGFRSRGWRSTHLRCPVCTACCVQRPVTLVVLDTWDDRPSMQGRKLFQPTARQVQQKCFRLPELGAWRMSGRDRS
ncbi:hypothetical protein BV25DRAFT_703504 [Artomyces pyxidatus]|uniref:Uncharacterized protein n=1 Tax=Artomyces pyxidatus TaxID=48021 RepID=A0ACB8SEX9_9AGAM|nr:hypothetical protein BV25DRAFT_703504 [Artomyces pyxidatus]